MKTSNQFKNNKEKFGIYIIRNLTNNKIYIGSTTLSFLKRKNNHRTELLNNKHKNIYLQRSYNKYGSENFEFDILEIIDDKNTVLDREQFWLDNYKAELYNINKMATSINSIGFDKIEEVIKRRSKTFAERSKVASKWYKKVKENKVSLENVPEKFKCQVNAWLNYIPKNKGKKTSEDVKKKQSLAKIGKKYTEQRKISKRNSIREKCKSIFVYAGTKFLGEFRSAKDIEDKSKHKNFILYQCISSRFSKQRGKVPVFYLQSVNINKSARLNKLYKGLLFSYEPLHEAIHVEKLGKIGEGLTANTEVTSEITKGSETL